MERYVDGAEASLPASLPYDGSLDAARKARDVQAIRLLTQLRDRGSSPTPYSPSSDPLNPSWSGGFRGRAAPAASSSSLSILTRRLTDLGVSTQQVDITALQASEDLSKAVSWGVSTAAAQGDQPSDCQHPLPGPAYKRSSPQAHSLFGKPGHAKRLSWTSLASAVMPSLLSSPPPPHLSQPSLPFPPSGAGELTSPTAADLSSSGSTSYSKSGTSLNATTTSCVSPSCCGALSSARRRTPVTPSASAQWPSEMRVLLEMGYSETVATSALRRRGSLEGAISLLLEEPPLEPSGGVEEHKSVTPKTAAGMVQSDGEGGIGRAAHQHQHQPRRVTPRGSRSGYSPAHAASVGAVCGAEEELELEDPILLMRLPISEMYMVDCSCGHWFGYETLYCCIKAGLADDLIPACPLANHPDLKQRCNYLLTQREIEHVLNKYKGPSQLPAEERRLWKFRRGKLVDGTYGWISDKVSDAFLRKGKIDAGCIECPNGRCGYWVEPLRPLEKQRIDCPKCLMAFCTLCKRPYHYRCDCDEVMTLTKHWLEWQQHGREPYLRQMAAEDSAYQSSLDQFNNRREAHQEEVRVAERNWDLLVADENYKASRCRRCPRCNRVIERIDGCDTMVCGRNAHGGNLQAGCGHGFNWNEAMPYGADIGQKQGMPSFNGVPPDEISRIRHMITETQAIKCDVCSSAIQGPLATCINCPSFNCCIRCQNKHTRGHVLRLFMDTSYSSL